MLVGGRVSYETGLFSEAILNPHLAQLQGFGLETRGFPRKKLET